MSTGARLLSPVPVPTCLAPGAVRPPALRSHPRDYAGFSRSLFFVLPFTLSWFLVPSASLPSVFCHPCLSLCLPSLVLITCFAPSTCSYLGRGIHSPGPWYQLLLPGQPFALAEGLIGRQFSGCCVIVVFHPLSFLHLSLFAFLSSLPSFLPSSNLELWLSRRRLLTLGNLSVPTTGQKSQGVGCPLLTLSSQHLLALPPWSWLLGGWFEIFPSSFFPTSHLSFPLSWELEVGRMR